MPAALPSKQHIDRIRAYATFHEVLNVPKSVFTSLLAPHTKVTGEQLATEEGILALGRNLQVLNRRRFFSTLAAAGAIAAISGTFHGSRAEAQAAAMPSIIDVLNFALNFEFLEAEFYSYGSTGISLAANVAASAGSKTPLIASSPTITASNVLNPPTVTLTGNQQVIVAALLQDEAHHIAGLQAAILGLGGTPITEPSIDFSAGGTIPAITTNTAYFAAARQFTALGNSAYAGAAASLIGNTTILETASQILGAEAQHLGAVNYLCITLGITTPSPDAQIDAQDVAPNSILASGVPAIFTVTSLTTAAPAVGIARTPQQVLGVAYGVSTPATTTPTAGSVKGGFFPSGVNGTITST